MKFTKEEIETAGHLYKMWSEEKYTSPTFRNFLDSLLKPERKKIVVEVEYDANIHDSEIMNITGKNVELILKNQFLNEYNLEVTELPEVFTRQDVIEFARVYHIHPADSDTAIFNKWLSERKPK